MTGTVPSSSTEDKTDRLLRVSLIDVKGVYARGFRFLGSCVSATCPSPRIRGMRCMVTKRGCCHNTAHKS